MASVFKSLSVPMVDFSGVSSILLDLLKMAQFSM